MSSEERIDPDAPLSDEWKAELDRRWAAYKADPSSAMDLDQVLAEARDLIAEIREAKNRTASQA